MHRPTRSHVDSARHAIGMMLALALSGLFASAASAQTVGQPLPPWTPGGLDIHQIHTGRGDAALFIFPDGTSLLADAGDGNPEPPRGAARAPDGSRTPGEWIARYARRMLAHDAEPAIDYAFSTHFHGDHMGGYRPDAKLSAAGDYKLTGFTDVAEHIPIRMMIDRGWPDYDYPRPLDNPMMDNYRVFLETQRSGHGMTVEQLKPGRNDQIVLRRAPERYANFEVRNIAANGEVWTGVGTTTRQHFPALADTAEEDWPTENQCSMAIRVSYGAFDYYTGGDMPGQPGPGYPLLARHRDPGGQGRGSRRRRRSQPSRPRRRKHGVVRPRAATASMDHPIASSRTPRPMGAQSPVLDQTLSRSP